MITSYVDNFFSRNKKSKLSYPINLEDVYNHLNIESGVTDNYLSTLIKVATDTAEKYINSDIALTCNQLLIKDFIGDVVEINEGNLFFDSGVTVTGATIYEIYEDISSFFIEFNENIGFETDINITYYSGFDSNSCPEMIKQAILIKIGEYYDVDRCNYVSSSYKKSDIFENLLTYYKKG